MKTLGRPRAAAGVERVRRKGGPLIRVADHPAGLASPTAATTLPQVLGVVGWKNSGKTTLISRLIPALRARGVKVSTVKHVHHAIDLDQPGKDTFIHRAAGAVDVVLFSESRWAMLHERRAHAGAPPDVPDLLRRLSSVDLVLMEGFKGVPMKRVEIQSADSPPLGGAGEGSTVAVVTDGPPEPDLPSFRRDAVDALADFVAGLVARKALAWPGRRTADAV